MKYGCRSLPPMSKSGKAASRSPLATCGGSHSEAEGDCATNAFPLVILQSINARTRTLPQSLRDSVSLRLGHATALTPHRGVIHYRVATSLPLGGNLSEFNLFKGQFQHNKVLELTRYYKLGEFLNQVRYSMAKQHLWSGQGLGGP